MTVFLVFPQSVTVHVKSDDSEAATLRVMEQAVEDADARLFEFCMTREELQRLLQDITKALSEGRLPE